MTWVGLDLFVGVDRETKLNTSVARPAENNEMLPGRGGG